MTKMNSHAASGKRFQDTLEFNRKIASVGYQSMQLGPSMSLRFEVEDEAKVMSGERQAKLRDRTVTLAVPEEDLIKILNKLVNPAYDMGFFAGIGTEGGDMARLDNSPPERLWKRVREACGLLTERYRYPIDRSYVYVIALNEHHAMFQLAKLGVSCNAELLQVAHFDVNGELCAWKTIRS